MPVDRKTREEWRLRKQQYLNFYIFDLISDYPVMKQIIIDKIILEIADNSIKLHIGDEKRERKELVYSTNSHNSYKKNSIP